MVRRIDAVRLRDIQERKPAEKLLERANRIGENDFGSFRMDQKKLWEARVWQLALPIFCRHAPLSTFSFSLSI